MRFVSLIYLYYSQHFSNYFVVHSVLFWIELLNFSFLHWKCRNSISVRQIIPYNVGVFSFRFVFPTWLSHIMFIQFAFNHLFKYSKTSTRPFFRYISFSCARWFCGCRNLKLSIFHWQWMELASIPKRIDLERSTTHLLRLSEWDPSRPQASGCIYYWSRSFTVIRLFLFALHDFNIHISCFTIPTPVNCWRKKNQSIEL